MGVVGWHVIAIAESNSCNLPNFPTNDSQSNSEFDRNLESGSGFSKSLLLTFESTPVSTPETDFQTRGSLSNTKECDSALLCYTP